MWLWLVKRASWKAVFNTPAVPSIQERRGIECVWRTGLVDLNQLTTLPKGKRSACLSYSCLSSPDHHLEYFLWSKGEGDTHTSNECRVNAAVLLT